jgi:uracil phosphoribosyltransferase
MPHIFAKQYSLLNDYLAELRNVEVQKDNARFRKNIERIGQIMAIEISKHLAYTMKEVITPLGTHESKLLAKQPVLATVLRAGLAMHQGFLNCFDRADNAYVSAYRKHVSPNEFEIVVEYMAAPDISDRTLILIDPMLATGQSMHLSYKALLRHGTPNEVIVASIIASKKGVEHIKTFMPKAKIFVADVDNDLDEHSYIVPGLGDAGDLCFGNKL